jgi:hypothetical protein
MIMIVTAAPDILIVQPRGIEIVYDSLGIFNFSHKARFTGIFAADDLVKNAVIPELIIEVNIIGNGFLKVVANTIIGFITNAMISIVAINTTITCT